MLSWFKSWFKPVHGLVLFLVLLTALIVFGIWRHDPYAETIEAACYPDLPKTWRTVQPGNRLLVVCAKPDGTVTKEVEVRQK